MSQRYRPWRAAIPGGTQQAFRLASNVAQAADRRMPEASALARWADLDRAPLGLPDTEDFAAPTSRQPLAVANWRRLRTALASGIRRAVGTDGMTAIAWLDMLSIRLGLDDLERQLLALALFYDLDERVEHLVDAINEVRGGPSRLQNDPRLLALLLASDPAAIEDRLQAAARLPASGLVQIDSGGDLSVLAQLARLVRSSAQPAADPFGQLLGPAMASSLAWDAFAHVGPQIEVAAALLTTALAERSGAVHLLLYGPPGTGKTSFAATLAARAGAKLRTIAERDDTGGEPARWERLRGLQLAQKLAPRGETVLLFDEAEDLFTRLTWGDNGPVANSRVFLHRLLEQTEVPVIWTANDITVLGSAVLRRMTMCLELKIPGVAVRTRLWRSLGQDHGVRLEEADAARLARLVPAAPALAATALRATRLAGGDAGTVQLILQSIARAVDGGRTPALGANPPDDYDPALVQADCDLQALADRLARPGAPRAISLLLSGPPGTGKSAFARHMAARMGLEVLHRRASDLLGPFVGQTEANIAVAFAEAAEAGAFLIFDEADSLLGDRAGARYGWEIS